MAAKPPGTARDAEEGQLLVVIHEFIARSEDELSLKKGDKILLIERDDDFGDGWYLGRHEQNGATGLFPEVYTRPVPKHGIAAQQSKKPPAIAPVAKSIEQSVSHRSAPNTPTVATFSSPPQPQEDMSTITTSPAEIETTKDFVSPGVANASTYPQVSAKGPAAAPRSPIQQSTVMNETLNVINEHITDMRRPSSSSGKTKERRIGNDSASEYSNHDDSRLSYIQGQETDEEEQHSGLTEREVNNWTPERVAEYLEEAGVEKQHCQIFVEQEISGDVLLGMDQSSLFLKEFELGSVGRRMRTWQKVKIIQDEIRGASRSTSTSKNHASQNSIAGDEKPATNGSMLPRMSQLMGPSGSGVVDNLAQRLNSQTQTPNAPYNQGSSRPSAASIRSMGHARRHSSMDMLAHTTSQTRAIPAHSKQPSLDQNWTMGGEPNQGLTAPTGGGFHGHSMSSDRHQFERYRDPGLKVVTSPDPDRGYISNGDVDSRKSKGVLTKKNASDGPHQRHSSYGSDRRPLSAAFKRNSKAESPTQENMAGGPPQSAASKFYHSMTNKISPRTVSAPTNFEKEIAEPPADPTGAPTVTKLEYDKESGAPTVVTAGDSRTSPSDAQTPSSLDGQNDQNSSGFGRSLATRKGIRAISDAVTGREKAAAATPTEQPTSPVKRVAIESPTNTGASTPSAGTRSIDYDPLAAQAPVLGLSSMIQPPPMRRGTKSKKATSAYQRGLQRKTPQEQMEGCDYSGWMKKKSSNLMTTWKPRLFVLRGRRLSYYYSENDTEEKGLIDISSHRVLPADNDRLTGLHATLTGAGDIPNSPGSPPSASTNSSSANTPATVSSVSPMINMTGTRSRATSTSSATGSSASKDFFIFKLVPPRSGLSRAVNFTKPMVHYFAVSSVQEGRQWMAAFLKATIDRDETKEVVTTYQHKTISLAKARARRELPPFLGGVDEVDDEGADDEENGNDQQRGRVTTRYSNPHDIDGVPIRSSSELRRSGLLSSNGFPGGPGASDANTTENSSVVHLPESTDTTTANTESGHGGDAGEDADGEYDDAEGNSSVIVNDSAPAIESLPTSHDGLGIKNLAPQPATGTRSPGSEHERQFESGLDSGRMDSMMEQLQDGAGETLPASTFGQPART